MKNICETGQGQIKSVKDRINIDKFISISNSAHGIGVYDYSKVVINKGTIKVCIICPEHGYFFQSLYDHMKGRGCKKCKVDKISKDRILTNEEFIYRSSSIHNNFYDYSKVIYLDSKSKVNIICPIHGVFSQRASDHLMGKGCNRCSILLVAKSHSLSRDEFISKSVEAHGDRYDYSKVEYTSSKNKVIISCPIHNEFNQTPSNHIKGQGCPKCGIIKRSNSKKCSKEEFIERSIKIHGYGRYSYTKVNYNNVDTKVCIICGKCKHEFFQTPMCHLTGRGCPHCRSSKGEIEIQKWFRNSNINYMYQHSFSDLKGLYKKPLRFDFFLPAFKLLVEFDGEQHFRPVRFNGISKEKSEINFKKVQHNDILKDNYCLRNNIPLIRINYKDITNIPEILSKSILR